MAIIALSYLGVNSNKLEDWKDFSSKLLGMQNIDNVNKNLVMSGCVTGNGWFFSILEFHKGITLPLLPRTFPYRTIENIGPFPPVNMLAEENSLSETSFVAP